MRLRLFFVLTLIGGLQSVIFCASVEEQTRLVKASRTGSLDTVSSLLEAGVSPNVKDIDGWTPLMYAAFNGHEDVVQALLNAEADSNHQDFHGRTPLMAATYIGNETIVTALLNAGADAHKTTRHGDTALKLAQRRKHKKIEQLLQHHRRSSQD